MVLREDEKRLESGVRPGQNLELNRKSGTDQVHKNGLAISLSEPAHPFMNNVVPSTAFAKACHPYLSRG